MACTLFASLVWFVDWITPVHIDLGMAVAPYEFAGAILGSLLVIRTNAGLERWWEARKLWGAITNQSRNLGIIVVSNGPDDFLWRREMIGWIASFGHVCRRSLRSQKTLSEIEELIGAENDRPERCGCHRHRVVEHRHDAALRQGGVRRRAGARECARRR